MRTIALALLVFLTFGSKAATFEGKYNTAQWVDVIITSLDGISHEDNVSATELTFKYREAINGPWNTLTIQDGDGSGAGQDCAKDGSETPESGDFCPDDSDDGWYRVYVPATVTDTQGVLRYKVTSGDVYKIYYGFMKIKLETEDEEVITLGAIEDDTGNTGVQVADKTGYSLSADQSGVTIGTVNTLTGHTPQTGDSFSRLVVASGTCESPGSSNALCVDSDVLNIGSAKSFVGMCLVLTNAANDVEARQITGHDETGGSVTVGRVMTGDMDGLSYEIHSKGGCN